MGINDILNLGSTAETVSNSILHIANQCKNYGVKEVSISSVTCTTLLNSDLTNDVNNAVRNKCQTSDYHFVNNSNITTEKIWKDGLHLRNSGEGIIINNFVQFLNSSHFFNKTTESSDPVLVFERENVLDKSNESLSSVFSISVIVNLNLNPVVQIRVILLPRLGSKK